MARRITEDLFDTLEVRLWGHDYTFRSMTRSISEQLDDVMRSIDALPDDVDSDTAARKFIEAIGLMLEPKGSETPGAEAVLVERWENDELGRDWLQAFMERLGEEAQARRRPTSAPATRR